MTIDCDRDDIPPEIITHTNIGELIRTLRESEKHTLHSLAAVSGYTYHTIYALERKRADGRRPRGGYWRTICDLLDSMDYDVIIKKRKRPMNEITKD